jgi:hypothetical protein
MFQTNATQVTKDPFANHFSFKSGGITHRFETKTSAERDSWVVSIEKIMEETKSLKDEIVGRESYKKTLDEYSASLRHRPPQMIDS